MIQEVQICSSCLKSATTDPGFFLDKFINDVQQELGRKIPEIHWQVQKTSCQRFCPPHKITLVVKAKLTMSRDSSIAAVVEEILSYFPKS